MIRYYYSEVLKNITNSLLERFTHLQVNRYNKARTSIVKTIDVPIAFAPVEKAQQDRLEDYSAEPESLGQRYYLQVPRLALVFNGLSYAPDRATGVNEYRYFQGQDSQHLNAVFKDIQPAPWNFTYTLFIRTDSISDFSQIIENILPYFNPKLYLRVKEFSFLNIERDLAVVLNDATPDFTDELDKHSMRQINGTITFSVEGWMYKPVDSAKLVNLIRTRYFFEGELAKDTLMDENGITHTPENVTVIVDAPMDVNFTIIQPPRVYEKETGAIRVVPYEGIIESIVLSASVSALSAAPAPSTTFNDIVWDGSKFVIVGDDGTIATTIDGTSPVSIAVPAGVELYDLTGVAYSGGVYVTVGTKTITPGNYRLLILTSSNGTSWAIDSEVDFASAFDPAISKMKVFYGNSEFVINGSTLHIIRGTPGSWSAPIVLSGITNPIKSMTYISGSYYIVIKGSLRLYKYNTSFGYVADYLIDGTMTDDNERGTITFDTVYSLIAVAYNNKTTGRFVIKQAAISDLSTWYTPINVVSNNYANAAFYYPIDEYEARSRIVGGNSTTGGAVYWYDQYMAGWYDVTAGEVSLNGVAYNGSDKILGVGYQQAIVVL